MRSVTHLHRQAGRLLNTAAKSLGHPASAQATGAVQHAIDTRTATPDASAPQSRTYDSHREDRQPDRHIVSTASTALRDLETEQNTRYVIGTSTAAEGTGAVPDKRPAAGSGMRWQGNLQSNQGSGHARQNGGVQEQRHQHASYISEIYIR